ncbi:outer membrane beta-barrel protein [Flavobacterium sp. SM15]|uniref:outer membrane beta-barrel protein n=1 Tax=Flavobacterium sp. SM15 TaxID=2908005 RepID=UPI001EDC923B|nr:outer membrane beta-barrel protein [Flavobacterium sp. SM15]MCG2610642.1 outer membrane beta-barrel protein [Flavobacterium sp. SM15]
MPKKLIVLVLALFAVSAFAQNSFSIKGKIIEEKNKLPIEAATVYLSVVKDSTLVDYTISNKNGDFVLNVKKTDKPTFLKVSMVGFEDYKLSISELLKAKDFGIIPLKEQAKQLGEIIVKAEAPPIRIKKDTLEFNAASFKVRPDANVETLLKQLPGVEIDSEGKITVNGKEVNQILVNGKPFFDKDGKVALQSLPSDIINKVQVTETKTKKEELSGKAATSNNASINLTIDEDKNKGLFGKFMAGYGTDDRYESSGLINYFKNKRKISVLASSNNINSIGFSMDEIFDNMGGGRSRSVYYNDNGSFGLNGMRFGGGSGITQSDMVGINYSDALSKKADVNGSYFFSDQHSKNNNRTRQVNFATNRNFITESASEVKNDRFSHMAKMEFEFKIDSTSSIVFTPNFSKSTGKDRTKMAQASKDLNELLLNESTSQTFDESDGNNFKSNIFFNKALNKRGRFINVSFENENARDNVTSYNKSATIYYQGTTPDDFRDQVKKNRNLSDTYFLNTEYSEPLKDSLKVDLALEYNWKKNSKDRKAFNYDATEQSYSDENEFLTNYLTSTIRTVKPSAGFSVNKKNLNFSVAGGTAISDFDNHSLYRDAVTDLNRKYVLPYARANMNYNFTKSIHAWMGYTYEFDFPTADQVLPVEDLSNPLVTYKGNADLDLNKNHNIYLGFSNYDYASRSGYSFYAGGDYYESQVVASTKIEDGGKRFTTYTNVRDTYSSWMGGNWSKSLKQEAHKFRFGFGMNANFGLTKGFNNDKLYEAQSTRLTPRVFLNYDYGELLTVSPSYNFTYSDTRYNNYPLDKATNVLHRFNVQVTNYWPKNWVFGNDFGYTYNSNIADGFKKDFYLWNTSLAYSFFNKKFTAKVKVYDVLNQNQSATRTISATTIRDEQNTVLKRYAMFSLTYKIEKFAGKEKPSRGRFMMH